MATEDLVDAALLERIVDWAGSYPEFQRHHAIDGLAVAQCFSPACCSESPPCRFLLGLAVAFWFWFDDRCDDHLAENATVVDFASLVAVRTSGPTGLGTPEGNYFHRLSVEFASYAVDSREHEWWMATAERTFYGMWIEDVANREGRDLSYSECVENGVNSSTIRNILAASSLVHRLQRSMRHDEPILCDLERHFCIHQRIQNDLYSLEKERGEGTHGRLGNVVLKMEHYLGRQGARAFAIEQLEGYGRLIENAVRLLGSADPIGQLIAAAHKGIPQWYAAEPIRFVACSERRE